MLRNLSYKSRFIISFIALVWLPIILAGGIAFYAMEKQTQNKMIQEYNQVRLHTKEHVLDTFFMPVEMLTGIEEVFSVQWGEVEGESASLLRHIKTVFPYLNRLYVINSKGSFQLDEETGILIPVLIENMSIINKKILVESGFEEGKVTWGKPTVSEDNESIELGVTIGYGEGLIYCGYDLASINAMLDYHPQRGVRVSVVGNRGEYILDEDTSKVLQLFQVEEFTRLLAEGYRQEGTKHIYLDRVDNMPWHLLIEVDERLFADGLRDIKLILFAFTAMILGMTGMFAYLEVNDHERYATELVHLIHQRLKGYGDKSGNASARLEREGLNEYLANMTHFVHDKEQEIERLSDKVQDFTMEIERYKLMVAKEKKSIEEAKSSRLEFLGIMGHEIRTPLNSIIGFMQLLRYTECSKQQREYIEHVMASSQSVKSIVNDIMDYTLIEVGQLKLNYQEMDFKKLLADILAVYAGIAEEKNIEFIVDMKEPLPIRVVSDPQKLRQILEHLLNNSFKFTRKGYVKIRINGTKQNNQEWVVYIAVEDTGIGIDAKLIPRLFEPFAKGNATIQKLYGGNGLGLSITKEIVNLMHGQIEVNSEPNVKTQFKVQIVVQGVTPVLMAPTSAASEKNGDKGSMNILLVEDHLINQQVFVNTLKLEHLSCDVAASGIEAIERCRMKAYDIIFMDLQMPQMDGYEATRRIRKGIDGYEQVPIIALTAHTLDEDKRKAREAGMTEYVTKPVDIEKIIQIIRTYNTEKTTQPVARLKRADAHKGIPQDNPWYEKLVRRFMEKTELDEETAQDIIYTYMQDVETRIIEFEQEWIGAGDKRRLQEVLHKLRGSSYSVYADEVIEDLEWIEEHLESHRIGVNQKIQELKRRIGI